MYNAGRGNKDEEGERGDKANKLKTPG